MKTIIFTLALFIAVPLAAAPKVKHHEPAAKTVKHHAAKHPKTVHGALHAAAIHPILNHVYAYRDIGMGLWNGFSSTHTRLERNPNTGLWGWVVRDRAGNVVYRTN
jgi:hypothetical protein